MNISQTWWGKSSGQDIFLYTIDNGTIRLTVTNFGCTITSLHVPARMGAATNVVLGYDSLSAYEADAYYAGCVVGRVAGRISGGGFVMDGNRYRLSENIPGSKIHLHGGFCGFNKKAFGLVNRSVTKENAAVRFHYRSPHLEEGYPGNLDLFVTYEVNLKNELKILYEASTDEPTHFNPTNHSYFNLSGEASASLSQELYIRAARYLEVDSDFIPTGRFSEVEGTPNDFRALRRIDACWDAVASQGYNECYELDSDGDGPSATLWAKDSGICMDITTSFPGMVFYAGGVLGAPFERFGAVCLETMFYPDTPNHTIFPSTILRPGQESRQETVYRFSLK